MRKTTVLGAIAVAGVFAGVWYFSSREGELTTVSLARAHADPGVVAPATATAPAAVSAAPSDPRLQALAVSPENGLIEFVKDAGGKVIMEIDRDPASARFGKPSREYMYSGSRVVGLTSYKPLGDQVQITRIMVAFRPDGGLEAFRETTDYEPLRKAQ